MTRILFAGLIALLVLALVLIVLGNRVGIQEVGIVLAVVLIPVTLLIVQRLRR